MSIEFFGQLPPWVLGVVSQSGGIPTGAMIERGSNANGEYVRFADGTQFCWLTSSLASGAVTTASGALFTVASASTWTYPAAFSVAPFSSGSNARASARWVANATVTATTSDFRVFSTVSSATSLAIDVFAVGRWF